MKYGFIFGLLLAGCVSATFSYSYYYAEFMSYDGKLIGKKPSEDLDAKVCAHSNNNHPCVVMLKSEFKAFYTDYLDLQDKLNRCQNP